MQQEEKGKAFLKGSFSRIATNLYLIAEDNPLIQELVLTILTGAGCEAELVENGQAALAKLEKADFDLVIIDNHMLAVMTGVEAIKIIRSEDGKRFTPILSLTADASDGSRGCASARANVYMASRSEWTAFWRPSRHWPATDEICASMRRPDFLRELGRAGNQAAWVRVPIAPKARPP